LQNAMRVIKTRKLSTNTATIHYKVQRRTHKAYLAVYKQSKSRMGRKTVLSPQQDNELSKRNIRLAQTGYPIASQILRMRVLTYCEKNNIPNPFVKETEMAGHAWVLDFFCIVIPSVHHTKRKI